MLGRLLLGRQAGLGGGSGRRFFRRPLLGHQDGDAPRVLTERGFQLGLGVGDGAPVSGHLLDLGFSRRGLVLQVVLGRLLLHRGRVVAVHGVALVGRHRVGVLGPQDGLVGALHGVRTREQRAVAPIHVSLDGVLLDGRPGLAGRLLGRGQLAGGLFDLPLELLDLELGGVVLLRQRLFLLSEGLYSGRERDGLRLEVRDLICGHSRSYETEGQGDATRRYHDPTRVPTENSRARSHNRGTP